jgi:hypothetical protein
VSLKSRVPLAGNIALTSALLIYEGQRVAAVSACQEFRVQADFTTHGLPSKASYRIPYTVDGLTRYMSLIHWGAGRSGMRSWARDSNNFVASRGANLVTLSVASNHSVPERIYADNTLSFRVDAASPALAALSYSVSEIRTAYGINNIPRFGSAPPNGSGQTIAIVDAYNAPDILTDLQNFDLSMHVSTNSSPTLLRRYGPASFILTVYDQRGENINTMCYASEHKPARYKLRPRPRCR